jgi:glycosyltransferase involved in cell wall biosynthesis
MTRPGVVVLHDAVLHHFLLGHLKREDYVAEFVYNYGEWRRPLAEELWEERGSSGVDPRYFQFPMLRRIADRALAIVVHNPGAASIARAHGARVVHVIPHFCQSQSLPDAATVAGFRQSIGVGQGTTLFGIFGFLRETKRVMTCIRAFRRLHDAGIDAALLLAGDCVSPDLRRVLETESVHPAIHRTGHLSEKKLLAAGAAIDCCLNLRYPAAGETSGIAIRMMGLARPVILTAGEENAAIPGAAALRVAPGVGEAEELLEYMAMICGFPQVGKEIGAVARRHVAEKHSLEGVVRDYWGVLRSALA